MMYEIETVVQGKGWSISRDHGKLKLIVNGEYTARSGPRGGQITVELPADFVTELLRNKKALHSAACTAAATAEFMAAHLKAREPHPYEEADPSPAAGSIANTIKSWPCKVCGLAREEHP